MSNIEVRLISNPGPRPPFRELAHYLWGEVDFDSDGNADVDPNWTELTLTRRPNYDERVDIDPVSENPLVLKIISSTPGLAQKTAEYLVKICGGELLVDPKDS
jgi:hypothetical protein